MSKQKKKQMVSPQPKQARKNKNKAKSAKSVIPAIIGHAPTRTQFQEVPVARAMVSGQQEFAQIRSRNMDKDGNMSITVVGRQRLQKAILRNTNGHVFTTSSGSSVPGILMAPYYIGGVLAKIGAPYQRYRFKKTRVFSASSASTSEPAALALGYNPTSSMSDAMEKIMVPEDEGGIAGALYQGIGALAAAAFGPVWGSIALEVAKPLGEAALKWYSNYKTGVSLHQDQSDEFTSENLLDTLRNYENELNTFLAANSTALPSGTRPTPPGTALNIAQLQGRRVSAIRLQQKTILRNELDRTVQGVILGATDGPYTGPVDGSGVAPLGEVFIEYEVEFTGVVGTDGLTLAGSDQTGDPLDDADPSDPAHMAYSAADRCAYVFNIVKDYTPTITVADPSPRTPWTTLRDRVKQTHGDRFRLVTVGFDKVDYKVIYECCGRRYEARGEDRVSAIESAYAHAVTLGPFYPALPGASAIPDDSQEWLVVPSRSGASSSFVVSRPTLDRPEYSDLKEELFKLPLPIGSHMANLRTRIFAAENGIVPIFDMLISLFTERNKKLNGGQLPPLPLPDSLRSVLIRLMPEVPDDTRENALKLFLQSAEKVDVA